MDEQKIDITPPSFRDAVRISLMVNWRTTGVSFLAGLIFASSEMPQLAPYKLALIQLSAAIGILNGARARDAGVKQ